MFGEPAAQLVAAFDADAILVIDVARSSWRRRRRHHPARQRRTLELGVVERGIALARLAPGIEMRKLHVEHRGLDFVETKVSADELVVVLRLHTVHAQLHELRRELGVVGHAHAGIAERAQVLGGEERQAADVADGARPPAEPIFRTNRLRGVFDDRQLVALGDRLDARHVGHLTV